MDRFSIVREQEGGGGGAMEGLVWMMDDQNLIICQIIFWNTFLALFSGHHPWTLFLGHLFWTLFWDTFFA